MQCLFVDLVSNHPGAGRLHASRAAWPETDVCEIDKLANEGWPIDNESIEALYLSRTSPDQVDAWLGLLARFGTSEYKLLSTGVPLIDPMIDDEFAFETVRDPQWKYSDVCQRLVDQHSELISQAHSLTADQPPVQFPIVFDSINTLLPDVQICETLVG